MEDEADDGGLSDALTDGSDPEGEGGCGGDPGGEPWADHVDRLLEELRGEVGEAGGDPGVPPEPDEPGPKDPDPDVDGPPVPPPEVGHGRGVPPDDAPLDVPPPHVGKGRGRPGKAGPRYPKLFVKDEAGMTIGYILVNEGAHQLDAHCLAHGCRMGRTSRPYVGAGRLTPLRASQGRGLAFANAWLRIADRFPPGEAGQAAHSEAARGKGDHAAELHDGASELRKQARVYVEQEPTLAPARLVERKPRDGEPLEPPGPFTG